MIIFEKSLVFQGISLQVKIFAHFIMQNSYYEDIKKDTDKLGIKLVATKGAEYIKLTRDPKGAVQFVLSHFE